METDMQREQYVPMATMNKMPEPFQICWWDISHFLLGLSTVCQVD